MLPDIGGVSVCRELRRDSEVAIIVLSVMGDELTKVLALDGGADDYLTKPFGSDELLARIRAALRRSGNGPIHATLVAGPLSLDPISLLVRLNGEELHLRPTEFNLLRVLMLNAGRVVRHRAILTVVWGEEYVEDAAILRTYINQLRHKLHDDPIRPRFIRTEPGVGYRFIACRNLRVSRACGLPGREEGSDESRGLFLLRCDEPSAQRKARSSAGMASNNQ